MSNVFAVVCSPLRIQYFHYFNFVLKEKDNIFTTMTKMWGDNKPCQLMSSSRKYGTSYIHITVKKLHRTQASQISMQHDSIYQIKAL